MEPDDPDPLCVPTMAIPMFFAFSTTIVTACSIAMASMVRLALIMAVVGLSFSMDGGLACLCLGIPLPISFTIPWLLPLSWAYISKSNIDLDSDSE